MTRLHFTYCCRDVRMPQCTSRPFSLQHNTFCSDQTHYTSTPTVGAISHTSCPIYTKLTTLIFCIVPGPNLHNCDLSLTYRTPKLPRNVISKSRPTYPPDSTDSGMCQRHCNAQYAWLRETATLTTKVAVVRDMLRLHLISSSAVMNPNTCSNVWRGRFSRAMTRTRVHVNVTIIIHINTILLKSIIFRNSLRA